MPRNPKLNYEPSRNKWRVVYRGKKHRFDAGSGKSDRVAKKAAEKAWRSKKLQIDGVTSTERKHYREYVAALSEWRTLLDWSREHDRPSVTEHARYAIDDLESRLRCKTLEPISELDLFLPKTPLAEFSFDDDDDLPILAVKDGQTPEEAFEDMRRADDVWRARLRSQERKSKGGNPELTLSSNIKAFLDLKRDEFRSGLLSANRVDSLRIQLQVASSFVGGETEVHSIDGKLLASFRSHLIQGMADDRFGDSFAHDCLASFKQFIRWLVGSTGKLEHLPKNIDDRQLAIPVNSKKFEVLAVDQITCLFEKATERTQLYVLLGLNCAMTQIDISDLKPSEVDWKQGVITRKRSKTSNIDSVPEVKYRLWPKTLKLLRKHRSDSTDRVLLTRDGNPLCTTGLDDAGKLHKTDSVRLAIRHLAKQAKVGCSMKHFKKTSASMLRNHRAYNGIESLFLGHAPRSMSDKHYTTTPGDLLNEAVTWLGEEFGLLEDN